MKGRASSATRECLVESTANGRGAGYERSWLFQEGFLNMGKGESMALGHANYKWTSVPRTGISLIHKSRLCMGMEKIPVPSVQLHHAPCLWNHSFLEQNRGKEGQEGQSVHWVDLCPVRWLE